MARTAAKWILSLAFLAALAGAGWYTWLRPEPTPLRTVKVERGDIAVTVLAAGAIEAAQLVSVGARVSGQINALPVQLGQEVKAGDVIAQIDRQEQENDLLRSKAALAQIEAQLAAKGAGLAKAEAQLTRQQQLGAGALVSKEALENAAADVAVQKADLAALTAQKSSAEVNVAQSQLALERTTVTAPIDGTVVAIAVDLGQTVSAAQNAPTIVKIANLDKMIVTAEISEADVVRVKAGQKASFTILGDPNSMIEAVVRAVEPAPQQLATSDQIASDKAIYYNALLEVDNPDRKLRIGMTAQVSIVLQQAQDVLLLPAGAVTKSRDGASVQVLEDGKPVTRPVKAGLTDKVRVEILEGLREGDEVVAATGTGSDSSGQGRSGGRPRGPLGF